MVFHLQWCGMSQTSRHWWPDAYLLKSRKNRHEHSQSYSDWRILRRNRQGNRSSGNQCRYLRGIESCRCVYWMELRDPNHDRGSSSIPVSGQDNTFGGHSRSFTLSFAWPFVALRKLSRSHIYTVLRNGDVLVVYSVTIKNITFNQIVVACWLSDSSDGANC